MLCIIQGTLYALFMHDAIYFYARLVNMMMGRGMDYRNGTAMFQLARIVEFTGRFKSRLLTILTQYPDVTRLNEQASFQKKCAWFFTVRCILCKRDSRPIL